TWRKPKMRSTSARSQSRLSKGERSTPAAGRRTSISARAGAATGGAPPAHPTGPPQLVDEGPHGPSAAAEAAVLGDAGLGEGAAPLDGAEHVLLPELLLGRHRRVEILRGDYALGQ